MKLATFIVILVIFTSGCRTTQFVSQKYPIIPKPNRPSISPDLNEEDFKSIIKYTSKLEIGIEEYNKFATEQNKKIEECKNSQNTQSIYKYLYFVFQLKYEIKHTSKEDKSMKTPEPTVTWNKA